MKIKRWICQNKILFSLFLFVFAFCLFLGLFAFMESDTYWHLKAGEYMIVHHTILKEDVFSWIVSGKYWMSHEWLLEILLFQLKSLFSSSFLIIYVVFSLCLFYFILIFPNREKYLKNIPFSLLWIAFFLIFCGFLSARPHLITYSFLAITLWLLMDLYQNSQSRKIYFLPFLTVLWANMHGGSSNLSYLLCFLFFLCGIVQFRFSKIESKRLSLLPLRRYFIVMIFCILAIFVNPHGIKMIFYPYQNMADSFMQMAIVEWHPTDLSNLAHYPYLILLLVVFLILLFSKRKIRFLDLVLFACSAFLGLKSIRFWPYVYIFCSYFIFDYIPKRKYDSGTALSLVMLSILCLGLFFTGSNFQIQKNEIVSSEIISILRKKNPQRLYNYYDYGGYLIDQDILVFVDGRADLYGPYNYQDYYNISQLHNDYEKLIKKYQFDYFLVPSSSPIGIYLKYHENYKKIIQKNGFVLYQSLNVSS